MDSTDDALGPDQLMEALRLWAAVFGEFSRYFSSYAGLHTTDSTALMYVVHAEEEGSPLTHAELSKRVGLTSGATSSLLNRLEAAGHVQRLRNQTDRRVVTVHSTPAVHENVHTFFADVDASLRAALTSYPPALVEQLTELLTTITAAAARHLSSPGAPSQQPDALHHP